MDLIHCLVHSDISNPVNFTLANYPFKELTQLRTFKKEYTITLPSKKKKKKNSQKIPKEQRLVPSFPRGTTRRKTVLRNVNVPMYILKPSWPCLVHNRPLYLQEYNGDTSHCTSAHSPASHCDTKLSGHIAMVYVELLRLSLHFLLPS